VNIPVPDRIAPAADLGHVHFIGIGGAGLSAIARLMHQLGIPVSGSDAQDSAVVAALRSEGITCFVGHAAVQVADADTVIASTAVRPDNPEVVEARRLGLRLWPRSAGLQSVLLGRTVVAVAGTHGKTTTTAMLTVALQEAGFDPTFAIGAEVESLGTNARLGSGDIAVVEADESDGAFLVYTPRLKIITNVDADHLDHWGSPEAYEAAFADFHRSNGSSIAADPRFADVVASFADDADVRGHDLVIEGGRTTFRVTARGHDLGTVELEVPGRHYAQDALLALAAGLELGADPAALIRGLARHRGAKRRMELLGSAAGVTVYDSYAHHPTEISGDLEAARSLAGDGRLVVVFQPHLVSRTRLFGVDMGRALSAADLVFVADLYLAREDPDPDVTSAVVADAVSGPPTRLAGPVDHVAVVVRPELRAGDLVLTLGAGDVTMVGPRLLELLRNTA
jgi:UDP-N-acetylmuramate--alanine ligase